MKRGSAKKGGAKKKPPGKPGRPSKFLPAVVQHILDGLSDGVPLSLICQPPNMPGITTVWDWQKKHPEFSESIARARDAGWDRIAHECRVIADTTAEGVTITEKPDGVEIKRGDMLGHRRLQIETRLKLLSKWDPKRYGDKVTTEISGPDGKPIKSETSHRISEELQDQIIQRTAEAARIASGVTAPASFRGETGE